MQPCKDCVHYGICTTWAPGVEDVPAELNCSFFKDKALTIDLPCPIDHESLFAIVDLYNRKKIVGQTVAKYDIDSIIIGFSKKPTYRCCNGNNEWMDFDGDEIGKTVFLTREAAEAALKGEQS